MLVTQVLALRGVDVGRVKRGMVGSPAPLSVSSAADCAGTEHTAHWAPLSLRPRLL